MYPMDIGIGEGNNLEKSRRGKAAGQPEFPLFNSLLGLAGARVLLRAFRGTSRAGALAPVLASMSRTHRDLY